MSLSSAGAIDSSPLCARKPDGVARAPRSARRAAADEDCLATVMPRDLISEREMQAAEPGGENELLRLHRNCKAKRAEPEKYASHDRDRSHGERSARRDRGAVEREPGAGEERRLSGRDERRGEREGEAAGRSVYERLAGPFGLAADGDPGDRTGEKRGRDPDREKPTR